jgi:uncharacterized protein (DUF4415 family)
MSESSPQEERIDMSEKTTGEVRFELDPNNPPRMSKEQRAALKSMTDDDIDYSDTPSQAGKPGRRVLGPRFGNPQDVVALEPDVLEFFKETGELSATRINAALREYAETHRKNA